MTPEQEQLLAAYQAALRAEREAEAELAALDVARKAAEKAYWAANEDHDKAMERTASAARALKESLV